VHSNSREIGTITVHVHVTSGSHVLIEVDDDGGPWTGPACDLTRGRGLKIVGVLATHWGITPSGPAGGRLGPPDWPNVMTSQLISGGTRMTVVRARGEPGVAVPGRPAAVADPRRAHRGRAGVAAPRERAAEHGSVQPGRPVAPGTGHRRVNDVQRRRPSLVVRSGVPCRRAGARAAGSRGQAARCGRPMRRVRGGPDRARPGRHVRVCRLVDPRRPGLGHGA
jgi:hypothetical protein